MNQIVFTATGITVILAAIVQVQFAVCSSTNKVPSWLPTGHPDVRYYYLPEIEVYYDAKSSRFIYYNELSWLKSSYLPESHVGYDLYDAYKVVITDYHGKTPYIYFKEHKARFAKSNQVEQKNQIDMKPAFNKSVKIMSPIEYSNKKHNNIISKIVSR